MSAWFRSCLVIATLLATSSLAIGAGDDAPADRALLQRVQRESPGPLWIRDGALTTQARALLAVFDRVEEFGLPRAEFAAQLAEVAAPDRTVTGGAERAARLEEAVSLAALRLMRELHDGRVEPREAGYELGHRRAPLDRATMLKALASSGDVGATLAALEPRSTQYAALKQTLARYRGFRESFVPLPSAAVIRRGDAYAGAAELRRRLEELGDAPAATAPATGGATYDDTLAAAVARFQRRHGLAPDGVLGARTRAELEVPMSRRIRQIELTLERWRWLPDFQAPAVIVNVPQFVLYTLPEPGDTGAAAQIHKIPVIVGRQERQTPVFDSAIGAVVIRPYWEVPRDIARDELLPLIRRDAGYLSHHDLEIVRGEGAELRVLPADADAIAALAAGRARLRQRPGKQNALGLIKFLLPNPYAVYLHSTPEAWLFDSDQRALSHGCVRVSDATALAAYLLRHTRGDWTEDAIEAATCREDTFTIPLDKPVPVFILYGTAVVDEGQTLFFDDIYGYDQRLEALLSGAAPPPLAR